MEQLELGPEVTIATAAYGNPSSTRLCLEAVLRAARGDFELILIDDFSPDSASIRAVFDDVKRQHANTRIFAFQENLEYSGSVNAILSHAAGEYVFFVSNDIFITPIYLRTLLESARENPRLGILRGSSNFVDNCGLTTHNLDFGKPINNWQQLSAAGAHFAERFGHAAYKDPFLVGDAFLATRAVIARIGTFDPNFYGYFADPDYGLRAKIAGFELALVPGAFAFHQVDANFAYLPETQRAEKIDRRMMRVYENWARFKMKYGLPVSMAYESIASIPWERLESVPFETSRHYCAPADYGRFLI
jgi:GT2 family glycosyltransferase